MFKDILKFKPENVIVCRDFTKAQVIELLERLRNEAEQFEYDKKNGPRDVNAIYINWIGFRLNPSLHSFMHKLNYSQEITDKNF